jgi:hypothetical protein
MLLIASQQRSSSVNIDHEQFYDENPGITTQLENIALYTGTDIFVLKPPESNSVGAGDPTSETTQNKRLKISMFGDYESVEHAKTRVLIMIDDLVSWECSVWFTCGTIHPLHPRALMILMHLPPPVGPKDCFHLYRTILAKPDLRSRAEERQVDRIRHENGDIFPSSLSSSIWIYAADGHSTRS